MIITNFYNHLNVVTSIKYIQKAYTYIKHSTIQYCTDHPIYALYTNDLNTDDLDISGEEEAAVKSCDIYITSILLRPSKSRTSSFSEFRSMYTTDRTSAAILATNISHNELSVTHHSNATNEPRTTH